MAIQRLTDYGVSELQQAMQLGPEAALGASAQMNQAASNQINLAGTNIAAATSIKTANIQAKATRYAANMGLVGDAANLVGDMALGGMRLKQSGDQFDQQLALDKTTASELSNLTSQIESSMKAGGGTLQGLGGSVDVGGGAFEPLDFDLEY